MNFSSVQFLIRCSHTIVYRFFFFGRLFLPSQLNIVKSPITLLSTSFYVCSGTSKGRIFGSNPHDWKAVSLLVEKEKISPLLTIIIENLNGINIKQANVKFQNVDGFVQFSSQRERERSLGIILKISH